MLPRIPVPIASIAQRFPASLKVGSVLYKASADFNDDTGRASTEITEWHVRAIKRKRASDTEQTVYLVMKVLGATWGKLSSRTGHVGWLPSTTGGFRDSFLIGEYMGVGFATTPEKAITLAIAKEKVRKRRYEAWDKEPGSIGYQVCIDASQVEIEALERRRKSMATKRKNAKAERVLRSHQ